MGRWSIGGTGMDTRHGNHSKWPHFSHFQVSTIQPESQQKHLSIATPSRPAPLRKASISIDACQPNRSEKKILSQIKRPIFWTVAVWPNSAHWEWIDHCFPSAQDVVMMWCTAFRRQSNSQPKGLRDGGTSPEKRGIVMANCQLCQRPRGETFRSHFDRRGGISGENSANSTTGNWWNWWWMVCR